MDGRTFAHTVFIACISSTRSVVLLGRGGPVIFAFASLSTNEVGKLASGDALTKMIKLKTRSNNNAMGIIIGISAKGKDGDRRRCEVAGI